MNTVYDSAIEALIQGCIRGDVASQKELYKHFYGYGMSISLRYSKNAEEAVEVLNDSFLKVFTKIKKYDPERSFKGWLRKIIINTALDNYRHNLKYYHALDIENGESSPAKETILSGLAYQEILAMVQNLSPAYRTVFNLYVMDGYTHEEIAQMLEISVGTSKSNLSKARENLRNMLKKIKMSTPDIPENELDDFFRRSLGNPDLDFREEDWLKMEQKLKDNNARKGAFYRRFLYGLLGLLLLITPVLTWYFVSRPFWPAVAVWENGNTEDTMGNTPNNTENTNTPDSKKTIGSFPAPDSNQPTAEKGDKNKPDIISSSGDRTESLVEKEILKQKNKLQQHELLTKEPPVKTIPAVRQKIGAAGKIAETPEHNGEEKNQKNPGKTTKISGLPSKKPDTDEKSVNTKTKKADKADGLNGQPLTRSQPEMPVENLPSGVTESEVIVIDAKSNKPLSGNKNEKNNTNSLVSEKNVTDKNTREKNVNNSTEGGPISILLEKNRQEGSHSTQKETATSDIEHSNTQPTAIYLIDPISSLSTRPLSYDIQLTDIITLNEIPVTKPGQTDSTRRNKLAIERVHSRLSANLLLSPDLSSIGFSKWRTPGTNIGVSLEYHISNRVSIIAGAIYSTKIYEADARNYSPASAYWASYYPKPVDVKGNCKVMDLPLNIRYNFLAKQKYNVYLSGGVSSYLMLKEDYEYIYKVYDPDDRKGWHGKNENKHFFKVINLSAGYERKLSQRFSFQAEPFIKLPTAGVGYGRIKLLSTGLFVSMKYNF